MKSWLLTHCANVARVAASWLVVLSLLRVALLLWSWPQLAGSGVTKFIFALIIGPVADISMLIYALLPLAILPILIPAFVDQNRAKIAYRRLFFSLLSFAIFVALYFVVAETVFWSEFHARFNFIAVDYLIYTNEVLRNLWESYPVGRILLSIFLLSILLSKWFVRRLFTPPATTLTGYERIIGLSGFLVLMTMNYFVAPARISVVLHDYVAEEIAKNGLASLFSAYFNNELEYEKFYLSGDRQEVFASLRENLRHESRMLNPDKLDIGRWIEEPGTFARKNVVLVSMESMSARFLDSFGNHDHLTPNLDRFARAGLHFSNIFATGTRTVRGLEALTLSVPPTPGQSIVRRPKNDDLYNLGDYFLHAGYQSEFLYGGYSYFDNMKEFFKSNEMAVWDRGDIASHDVTFSNAWGVCDEDLFELALRRADAVISSGKPFFQIIMTTSNHRPYTYPQKIDIPSGSGRAGAVKYADFAIGSFIEKARRHTWFKDTVFVFVADHDASVAGNIEIPVGDYRIPFIVYSPGFIAPRVVALLGSQIDVAPTVLGLLNTSYKSHFFGHSLLKPVEERAFLATYQTVGMLKEHVLTLLGPNKQSRQYLINENDNATPLPTTRMDLLKETISFYQTASFLFSSGHMRDTGDDDVVGAGGHFHH